MLTCFVTRGPFCWWKGSWGLTSIFPAAEVNASPRTDGLKFTLPSTSRRSVITCAISRGDSLVKYRSVENSRGLRECIGKGCAGDAYRAFLQRVEGNEDELPDTITCNRLLRLLGDHGMVTEALDVYEFMKRLRGCMRPTVVTYSTLMSRLVRARKRSSRFDGCGKRERSQGEKGTKLLEGDVIYACKIVWKLLENLMADGLRPDEVVFNSIMGAAAAAGDAELARRAYSVMVKAEVEPTVRTFNQMLAAVARDSSQTMQAVEDVMGLMRMHNLLPDVFSYSTLIDACALRKDAGRAFLAMKEMKQGQVRPNARTLSSLIAACCRSGNLEKGEEILDVSIKRGLASVHAYTILIDHYGKAGNLDRAFELFADMFEHQVEPTAYTFSALINSCAKAGAVDVAFELFEAMQRTGVSPNKVTYTSLLLAARHDEDVNRTTENDQASEKSSGTAVRGVSREAYGALMSRLARNARRVSAEKVPLTVTSAGPSEARSGSSTSQLLTESDPLRNAGEEKMRDSVGEKTEDEYLALMNGFASKNELFQAFLVLGEMKRAGFDIRKAYNALLGVAARAEDFGAAVDVFESMKHDGLEPDVKSYTNLMKALTSCKSHSKSDTIVRVFLLFLEMQSAGVKPDKILFNALIDACAKCAAADKALEVFASMKQLGMEPDTITYTSLISALCAVGDVSKALEALKEMRACGCPRSGLTYTTIISAALREGQFDTSLELLGEMNGEGIAANAQMYSMLVRAFVANRDSASAEELMRHVTDSKVDPILRSRLYERLKTVVKARTLQMDNLTEIG